MTSFVRGCAIVIGISVAAFVFAQLLFDRAHCLDCGARIGFPFSYMQDGTRGTVGHFIWLGFIGDCAFALAVGILALWMSRARKVLR